MKVEELPSAPVTFIIHRLTLLNCNIEVDYLIGLKIEMDYPSSATM